MSEWKETTLSSVADIDSGFAFKSKEYTNNGNLRVVRGKNVTVGTMRWGSDAKFWDYPTDGLERYFLEENDIVIGMDGSKIGENRSKIKEVDLPAILAQRVGRVRAKDGNSQEFLWQAINSPSFVQYIKSIHTGTSIPHISQKQIGNFEVLIPSPSEQKLIAFVFSSLDDKIDLLHRQNQTLEQMAETLFRQWFLEEADEDWKESTIKEFDVLVTDYVANGSFASLKENVTLITDREEYALFIRNTDLKSGFANKVYVDEHAYNFLSKTKLFGGEVIISSVGDVGSVFRCPKFDIPMTLGNNIIMLNSKYNLFFYLLFQSKYGQDMIYGITSGSVQQKFNKTAFRGLKINYPSLEYIAEFESFVKPYFDKIDFNQTQIRTLTNLRDTLLPKLMSGEVRVEMAKKFSIS